LYRVAAEEFVRRAQRAVHEAGRFTVALSGGSTPKALYALLARDEEMRQQVPWDKVYFFWGDERQVPPYHPDSNYRMAHAELLSKVPVPAVNVRRILAEQRDPESSARQYERTLQAFFRLPPGQMPRFDLVLLGLGADGHTASLFPGTTAVHESWRLVAANWVEKLRTHRITLTVPVFNNAACVIFLVAGEDKATALRAVLEGVPGPERLPAQRIHPREGELMWLVDRPAGRLLNGAATKSQRIGHAA
jgi:6-phosphogluconolactonase